MGLSLKPIKKSTKTLQSAEMSIFPKKEGESRRGPDGFAQDWRQRRRKPLRSGNKQMHIRSERKKKEGKWFTLPRQRS